MACKAVSISVHARANCPRFDTGRDRIVRLRRELGLRFKHKRKSKATTNSRHALPVVENLLSQFFAPTRPNVSWVKARALRCRAASTAMFELGAAAAWAGNVTPDLDVMLALCEQMRKRRLQSLSHRLPHAHARRKNPSQQLLLPGVYALDAC